MYENDEFHIVSIQPYIILKSELLYRHMVSAMGISHFFSFKCSTEEDAVIPLVPDGCTNLIFKYLDGKLEVVAVGNTDSLIDLKLEKGCECFCVRFMPGENPCFDGMIKKENVNKVINVTAIPFLKEINEKMAEETTFIPRMCAFLEEYRKFYNQNVSVQKKLFRQIIRLIVDKKGLLKISELEVLTGYSARYINHIFDNQCGISAKQFCNSVKMHYILKFLSEGSVNTFSKLAGEYKFYDQAHFIHEFKEFTGKTPGDYTIELEQNDFLSNVIEV